MHTAMWYIQLFGRVLTKLRDDTTFRAQVMVWWTSCAQLQLPQQQQHASDPEQASLYIACTDVR